MVINELTSFALRDYLLLLSTIVLLLVIFVLFKNYTATLNIQKKLFDFSRVSKDPFAAKLLEIETASVEYRLNPELLGSFGKIFDLYAVTITDKSGIISYASEKFCELCGFDRNQLIGKNYELLASGMHPRSFWDEMRNATKGGKVWHGEICNKNKKGEFFWVDTLIMPLSIFTNEKIGYISLGTDITELKSRQSELLHEVESKQDKLNQVQSLLLHSEKMASLGTISAGIAHEINNPIAFVSSNIVKLNDYLGQLTAVIKNRAAPNSKALQISTDDVAFILEDYPSLIEETSDGINRIRKIVKDLKCFSHEQQEGFLLLDIHECIETSLNLASCELKYRVTVHRDFGENIPLINGSETQLSQVFVNLFVNAAQAIEKEGEIRISTRIVDNKLVIQTMDNGAGIKPDILNTIFEPFFTTKPVGQGTGLGLSISHDIIKRHGGEISATSKVGVGTTFIIELPLSIAGSGDATVAA